MNHYLFSIFCFSTHLYEIETEMAEGNGEIIEEMATSHKTDGNGEPERTADYPKLVEYGLDKRVNFIFDFLHFLFLYSFLN